MSDIDRLTRRRRPRRPSRRRPSVAASCSRSALSGAGAAAAVAGARRHAATAAPAAPRCRRRLVRGRLSRDRPRPRLLRNDAPVARSPCERRNDHAARPARSDGGAAAAASAARAASPASRRRPTMDRRAFLQRSGLGAGAGAFASAAAARHDGQGRRRPTTPGGQARGAPHRLHALLGRLRGRRGGRERRLGAPGAGVRLAAQPRRALRQGRGAARARPRRATA